MYVNGPPLLAVEQNNAQLAGVSVTVGELLLLTGMGGGVNGKPSKVESKKHPISSYIPAAVTMDGTWVGPVIVVPVVVALELAAGAEDTTALELIAADEEEALLDIATVEVGTNELIGLLGAKVDSELKTEVTGSELKVTVGCALDSNEDTDSEIVELIAI